MMTRCPDCHCFRTHPDAYRWYEVPLALLLVQPYRCRRCGRRFHRPKPPDLLVGPFRGRRLVLR